VQAARRRAGACLALGLAFVSIVPVLLDHGLPLLQARAVALATGTLDALLAAAALDAVVRGLPSHRNAAAAGGIALVAATWWIWIRSVALLDFTLYDAFTATVVVGWIVATIAGIGRLAVGAPDGPVPDAAHDGRALAVAALRRSLLVAAVTLGSAWVLRDWLVEVLEVVAPDAWPGVSRALSLGAGVALAGYLVHEALRTWSALRFGAPRPPSMPGGEDDDQFAGSRMATALPIVARSLLAISIGVGALLGLANLGINVGPLLAGAGIFGLAISFGSQALVRDIVSGFFFIADDAFRVGEYIDAGRHKGSVERISLRSLRLRHQNGQVHTIPYGQIAAVTNFSRDWATMKFNLRLAPETDLELVRKTAKRVGLALLDDPEWQAEFLVPLKLQGIADIVETAVVLRFKFTARPLKVASLQREVVRRLFDALLAAGVRFATNALVVRSDETGEDDTPRPAPVRERAPVWARFGLLPRRPSDRIRTRRPPALNVRTP